MISPALALVNAILTNAYMGDVNVPADAKKLFPEFARFEWEDEMAIDSDDVGKADARIGWSEEKQSALRNADWVVPMTNVGTGAARDYVGVIVSRADPCDVYVAMTDGESGSWGLYCFRLIS